MAIKLRWIALAVLVAIIASCGSLFYPWPDKSYAVTNDPIVFRIVEERRYRLLPYNEWGFSFAASPRCVPTIGNEKRGRYGFFEMTDYKWEYWQPQPR